MKLVFRCWILVCISLGLTAARQAPTQGTPLNQTHSQAPPAAAQPLELAPNGVRQNFGFFSANTRTQMDFGEARRSLNSFEQANIVAVADYLVCHLTGHGELHSAIGEWRDGAENSAFLEIKGQPQLAEYLLALLGRYAHQKYVLIFSTYRRGTAVLWRLSVPAHVHIAEIRDVLNANGIQYNTIVPEPNGSTVIVFDQKNEFRSAISNVAVNLGAKVKGIRGDGGLLGADDRQKAMEIFDRVISRYEKAHGGVAFSRELWSRSLHDASGRSCTKN
jgi:hypothetical protein